VNATSLDLLRLLGSGIQPLGAPGQASSAPAVGPGSFADLLKQAQDGSLVSKLPVTIGPDAGVKLDDNQLARVSLAADKLEAAGVKTALVNIDGQKLILDVHSRQITGAAGDASGIVAGVDGAVDLGDQRAAGAAGTTGLPSITPPGGLASNQSLMNLLAELAKK